MKINSNNCVERCYHGVSLQTIRRFNELKAILEYDEEREIYMLYVDDDLVDENKDPNKLER